MSHKWQLSEEEKAQFTDALMQHLPALRAKAEISQAGLAQMIGISRQTYSAAEGRQHRLSWEAYLALLFFFDSNHATREMLHSLGAYPTALVERFNRGTPAIKTKPTHPLENKKVLAALDAQALHTLRSVLLVEYARCTGLTDIELLRSHLADFAP